MMVPFPNECRESKVRYPAPWVGKGGKASWVQGLPWGIDILSFPERKERKPLVSSTHSGLGRHGFATKPCESLPHREGTSVWCLARN
ncbi:MAG: hypothetical protein CVV52_08450 [Spirochaetae bacterium HGW-Spirochaetae-8]|jgi:hypothetical protein|nr:MAG: hypothetical protein CVV52_08450 [Spirochaetae bacterium HGW-Spirochaetae-8]